MNAPTRVQLSRRAGWRMPANTIKVSRPSKYGNPYTVAEHGRDAAVRLFRQYAEQQTEAGRWNLDELRGRNLACWCRIGEPCHADVLLEQANKKPAG
jgi:hypothetical protein